MEGSISKYCRTSSSKYISNCFIRLKLDFKGLCPTKSILQGVFLLSIFLHPSSVGVEGKLTIVKDCGEIVCKPHHYCSKTDESCRPCEQTCDPGVGNYDRVLCETDCQDYLHDLWYIRKPENDSSSGGPRLSEELYFDLYYKMQEDLRLLKILIGVVIILSTCVMLALFCIMLYFNKRIKHKLRFSNGMDALEGATAHEIVKANANGNNKKKNKILDLPIIYSNTKAFSLPINQTYEGSNRTLSSLNNNNSRSSTPDLVLRSNQHSRQLNNPSVKSPPARPPQKNSTLSSISCVNLGSGLCQNSSSSLAKLATKTQAERQQNFRREPSESTLPEYHAYDNPALVPSPTHM